MKNVLIAFTFLVMLVNVNAQPMERPARLQTQIVRTDAKIKIDGVMDESEWLKTPLITGFTQNEPNPGTPSRQKTEVRVLYDNTAIYIGAIMHDNQPDSIMQALSLRDELDNTDWFGVVIDAYRDGNNGLGFLVSPRGIQLDTKWFASTGGGDDGDGGEDINWNAVWNSAAKINGQGWVAEMAIPYSALRFPNSSEQSWNINFARQIRRSRETSFWNEVKPDVNGFVNQCGTITGIKDIKAPPRLAATPFVATYFENYFDKNGTPKSSWGRSFNAGMDVKYGISDAFTLDMTLIPDFGQVQFDNQILNLSPFEVQFDENRQFFTEGTELFNKVGLFYSRRVGGSPLHYGDVYDQLQEGEEVIRNPATTQLYNATKLSGRNKKGLGIGVFNATAAPAYATIRSEEGGERLWQTSPLTNYNVLAFDQNLKNNSYVTFINTNVMRNGADYDANVTGSAFEIRNKANTYSLKGEGAVSQKYFTDETDLGHKYNFAFEKNGGNFQYTLGYNVESHNYDPNDLGYLFSPNEKLAYLYTSYNIFKPFGKFNKASFDVWSEYNRLQKPDAFQNYNIGANFFLMTKKFFAFGGFTNIEPVLTYDFFEPRSEDFSRYYTFPKNYNVGGFISTDYSKKIALDVETNYRMFEEDGRRRWNLSFSPRWRVNDHLNFSWNVNTSFWTNDVGWAPIREASVGYEGVPADAILFSIRDQEIVENAIRANYTFNNKMGISFRPRHYWTKVKYDEFRLLDDKGLLQPTTYQGKDEEGHSLHHTNFNIFTVDMVFTWRFAPGSDLFVVWKESIFNQDDLVEYDYLYNARNLFGKPQTNSFSVKVIYYLDYLSLKKKG